MTTTTFIDNQTVIYASWLNDVNTAVYNGTFPNGALSLINLSVSGSVSGAGYTTLVNDILVSPGTIGSTTPNSGYFTNLSATAAFTGTTATLNSLSANQGTYPALTSQVIGASNTPSGGNVFSANLYGGPATGYIATGATGASGYDFFGAWTQSGTKLFSVDGSGAVNSNKFNFNVSGKQSLSANGYSYLTGGLIMQWGTVQVAGSASTHVNFPITFPNGYLSFTISQNIGIVTTGIEPIGQANITQGGVDLFNGNAGPDYVFWIALGY